MKEIAGVIWRDEDYNSGAFRHQYHVRNEQSETALEDILNEFEGKKVHITVEVLE